MYRSMCVLCECVGVSLCVCEHVHSRAWGAGCVRVCVYKGIYVSECEHVCCVCMCACGGVDGEHLCKCVSVCVGRRKVFQANPTKRLRILFTPVRNSVWPCPPWLEPGQNLHPLPLPAQSSPMDHLHSSGHEGIFKKG